MGSVSPAFPVPGQTALNQEDSAVVGDLLLSRTSAAPGDLLRLSKNTRSATDFQFEPSLATSVIITTSDGIVFEIPGLNLTTSEVSAYIPFDIDPNTLHFRSTNATVQVRQGTGASSITREASEKLQILTPLAQAGVPGETLVQYLQDMISSAQQTRNDWILIQSNSNGTFDSSRLLAELDVKIGAWTIISEEIRKLQSGSVSSVPIGTLEGQTISLDLNGLRLIDGLITSYLFTLQANPEVQMKSNGLLVDVGISLAVATVLVLSIQAAPVFVTVTVGVMIGTIILDKVIQLGERKWVNPLAVAARNGENVLQKLTELKGFLAQAADGITLPDVPSVDFSAGLSRISGALKTLEDKRTATLPTQTEVQTLEFNINEFNRPILQDDSFPAVSGQTLNVPPPGVYNIGEIRKNQDISSYDQVSTRGGAVVMDPVGGGFSYTPPSPLFEGTDTFTYTIVNRGLSDTATVTIEVTAANPGPNLRISPANPSTACSLYAENAGIISDVDSRTIQFSAQNSQGITRWESTAGSISSNGLLRVGRSQGVFMVTAHDDVTYASTNVTVENGMLTVTESAQWVISNQLIASPPVLDFSISGASLSLVERVVPTDGTGRPSGTVTSYYRCRAPLLPFGSYHNLEVVNRHPRSAVTYGFESPHLQEFAVIGALQPSGTTVNGGIPVDRATVRFPWRAVQNSR